MHMFKRKTKKPIFVTPSREIATILRQEEMEETIEKLFEKIQGSDPCLAY